MRGQKTDEQTKEKALAMLAVSNNLAEVARKLKVPESTLRDWRKGFKDDKKFVELRNKKKKEFIALSWKSIEMASIMLQRRLARAVLKEDLLDEMLANAQKGESAEIRKQYAKNIASMKLDDISKLSVTLGTLYDKQALAGGEFVNSDENAIKKFEDFDDSD